MAEAYALEPELTLAVDPTAVCELSSYLRSERSRRFGEDTFELVTEKVRTSIHLFFEGTDDTHKRRVQFSFRKGVIVPRSSNKLHVGTSKYESQEPWPWNAVLLTRLRELGEVVAALGKERRKWLFRSTQTAVELSLDRVIGFDPANPARSSEPYHHLEIETEAPAVLERVRRSALMDSLGDWTRPARFEETKWMQAARHCSAGFVCGFDSLAGLEGYIRHVRRTLFEHP